MIYMTCSCTAKQTNYKFLKVSVCIHRSSSCTSWQEISSSRLKWSRCTLIILTIRLRWPEKVHTHRQKPRRVLSSIKNKCIRIGAWQGLTFQNKSLYPHNCLSLIRHSNLGLCFGTRVSWMEIFRISHVFFSWLKKIQIALGYNVINITCAVHNLSENDNTLIKTNTRIVNTFGYEFEHSSGYCIFKSSNN